MPQDPAPAPGTFTDADSTTWIVHDERRMHLPELAGECARCLKAETAGLRQALADLVSEIDSGDDHAALQDSAAYDRARSALGI